MKLDMEMVQKILKIDENAMSYLGQAMASGSIRPALKGMDDFIKHYGVDWQYDLTKEGAAMQELFEELYNENRNELE